MDILNVEPILHLHGFYRSDPMFNVTFVGGERKEEEYYLYYQFLDAGIWVSKTHHSSRLNFDAFLNSIDLNLIKTDPHHDEPLMGNNEFFYQSGEYTLNHDRVRMTWKNTHIDGKQRSWEFAIRGGARLETALGDYSFEFIEL